MYCQQCGTNISEEANFCSHCGKPQKPGSSSTDPEIYEICQTGYEIRVMPWFGPTEAVFIASAVCPKRGNYLAAESPMFITAVFPRKLGESPIADFGRAGPKTVREREAAFDALTQKLIGDGWQPVSQSEMFRYQHKFRRAVRTD